MISYLPKLYPDELVYSWLSRYYIHSGCLAHKMALEELYCKRSDNPSKEFIGNLKPEIRDLSDSIYDLENLTLQHTMFPQYARFVPRQQKIDALNRLSYDCCNAHHLFAVLPRSEGDAFLKYCPLCASEDREVYGETYWHRTHQLRGLTICPKHSCRLISSEIPAKSEMCYTLDTAGLAVKKTTAEVIDNDSLLRYSQFLIDVFNAPMNFNSDITASVILYDAMDRSGYVKKSGKNRYTKQLSDDMNTFYNNIGVSDISSFFQIQRVLLGERFDFTVVCQIAFFLGTEVEELTNPHISSTQIEREKASHYMTDKPKIDWAKYDIELAPELEHFAYDIYNGISSGRPERVSEKLIYRKFKLPKHQLEVLPRCKAVLQKYSESYEETWARRLIWAYSSLKKEKNGSQVYATDLRKRAGIKMKNFEKIIPYLSKYTGRKTCSAIIRICNITHKP